MTAQINDNVIPTFVCECCGEEYPTAYAHDTAGGKVCGACLNRWYVKCDHCGMWVAETTSVDNEQWCEECVEADAAWCEHCESYHEDTTSVLVRYDCCGRQFEEWCQDCVDRDASTCNDCGTVFANTYAGGACGCDVYGRVGYIDLCAECQENYYTCDECGRIVNENDVCECDGYYYCPDCCPDDPEGLQEYHHTDGVNFIGAGPLYMGVELETESNNRATMAQELVQAIGPSTIECKRDSSLYNGCEIVTQPIDPCEHMQSSMWDTIINICKSNDATSHDNGRCGLHVHINRTFLADCHESAWDHPFSDQAAYIMDTILSHHPAEWLCFSRRSTDSMRQWAQIDGSPDADQQSFSVWKSKKSGRYYAINTSNCETVEIRLWRGTLRRESLRATLQASAALAIIARAYRNRVELVRTWTWEQVKRHLYAALAVYGVSHNDLKNYMAYRGL